MFGESKNKNRRLTAKERADDLEDAIIWGRYPRSYKNECYYYKDTIPEPVVNFALNFKF
jgi:hypothetical protein